MYNKEVQMSSKKSNGKLVINTLEIYLKMRGPAVKSGQVIKSKKIYTRKGKRNEKNLLQNHG